MGSEFQENASQTEGFGDQVPWQNMTFLQGILTYDNLNRMTKVPDTNYLRYYSYDAFGRPIRTGREPILTIRTPIML